MEVARGTVYQPEDIALMKTVLEESATLLLAGPAHVRDERQARYAHS